MPTFLATALVSYLTAAGAVHGVASDCSHVQKSYSTMCVPIPKLVNG